MDFPILSKKIRKAQLLVFFDLEATQVRHQAIAFALTAYKKEKDQLVFDDKDPINYFSYIRTDDVIGPIVQEMTGITKDTLIEKGNSIHEVILEISKLLRHYKDRCFISYGSMDIEILNQSIDHNNETEENFLRNITKTISISNNIFIKESWIRTEMLFLYINLLRNTISKKMEENTIPSMTA